MLSSIFPLSVSPERRPFVAVITFIRFPLFSSVLLLFFLEDLFLSCCLTHLPKKKVYNKCTMYLPLFAAPARIINFGSRMEKKVGDSLELPCKALGVPIPTSIEWLVNGERKVPEVQTYVDEQESVIVATLRLPSLSSTDEGNYTCVVKNEYGVDSTTFTIILHRLNEGEVLTHSNGTFRPRPILKVEETTSKSIRVRIIEPPGSPGSPLVQKIFFKSTQPSSEWKHFVVEEGSSTSSSSPSTLSENGTFLLSNLLCGTHYQIYVMNIYRDGQNSTSEVLLAKTVGREPLAPPVSQFYLSLTL